MATMNRPGEYSAGLSGARLKRLSLLTEFLPEALRFLQNFSLGFHWELSEKVYINYELQHMYKKLSTFSTGLSTCRILTYCNIMRKNLQ